MQKYKRKICVACIGGVSKYLPDRWTDCRNMFRTSKLKEVTCRIIIKD